LKDRRNRNSTDGSLGNGLKNPLILAGSEAVFKGRRVPKTKKSINPCRFQDIVASRSIQKEIKISFSL
jgi:hypothetical protein